MSDLTTRSMELLEQAGTNPVAVEVDELEPLLDHENGHVRHTALRTLALVCEADPDRVRPVVDSVRDRVDDSYSIASSTALVVLSLVGETEPDAVRPIAPAIIDRLDDPSPGYRFRAASALVPLAEPYPDIFVEHADDLVDLLRENAAVDPMGSDALERDNLSPDRLRTMNEARTRDRGLSIAFREILAHLLVHVASVDPAAIAHRLETITDELDESADPVRQALVEVFRHVAEADAVDCEIPIGSLVALLEDGTPTTRARVVRTLGFAEAIEAVAPLRSLADRADDEAVSELASETADWLADR
ncbi:hypothetical protein EA462_16230 [Natrarchaeobius halalkaliphilus]|uniref:HEAT repeat domain-containing protein n=1 Tax=Natrarchaeobius halalkaliphilus TaxID=1679091 RepID=A0A3N6LK08_9EURY|nr:HEAT repeat domain-containing protein [Natrarchaeobius halalkaliphilus]RQG86688.1 hypothetical protein EA462_16230 [Natrarchaeobius halalkaliphilus]